MTVLAAAEAAPVVVAVFGGGVFVHNLPFCDPLGFGTDLAENLKW